MPRHTSTVTLLVAGLVFPVPAFAYLDPGTGSFILQMVIAGAVGAMLYIKLAWAQTKLYIARLFGRAPEDDGDDAAPAGSDDGK